MTLQGSLSFGKILVLAVWVSLMLCSSHAELSNGPVTQADPPFIQNKANKSLFSGVFVNGTTLFAVPLDIRNSASAVHHPLWMMPEMNLLTAVVVKANLSWGSVLPEGCKLPWGYHFLRQTPVMGTFKFRLSMGKSGCAAVLPQQCL